MFACGPFPPEQILISYRVVLRTPVGDYAQEVLALTAADGAPALPPGMTRPPEEASPRADDDADPPTQNPPDPDVTELRDALEHAGVPADKRDALASAYQKFQADLAAKIATVRPAPSGFRFDERARAIRTEAAPPDGEPFVLPPELADGLPVEWRDYQEGACRFWHNDLPGARAAWERLLARPLAERRYCSTKTA